MQRDLDTLLSNSERNFILKALKEEQRIDGRRPFDYRKIQYQFPADEDGSATVQLGATRVMAVVTAALEAPFPDRPNEGSLRFNVELSPMASPAFEVGRPGEAALEAMRLLERALRDSRAVDLEALCVLVGQKVWHVRVDVHVLDHAGNLADAAGLAALAALMAFRRPEASVAPGGGGGGGGERGAVTLHAPDVREPLPLSLHHLPLAVTFGLFEGGEAVVLDPSLKEAAAAAGMLTVIATTHGEVCALHKPGGIGISLSQTMRLVRVACAKAAEVAEGLRAALRGHETARVARRVCRRGAQGADAGALLDDAAGAVAVVPGLGDPGRAAAAAGGAHLDALAGSSGARNGSGGALEPGGMDSSDAEEGSRTSARPGEPRKLPRAGLVAAAAVVGGARARQGPSSLPEQAPGDNFEAIAAMIAGAAQGRPHSGDALDLQAAVKPKSGKRAKVRKWQPLGT
ncbi:hypothetical protein WJX81_005859 [Elliptochloris bilobata]|uniref:Uncharacterized protein n=1 Tax=Elliptochloris bilobata TaxID=381761 RepID=A0AAW1S9U8_9CHLO